MVRGRKALVTENHGGWIPRCVFRRVCDLVEVSEASGLSDEGS